MEPEELVERDVELEGIVKQAKLGPVLLVGEEVYYIFEESYRERSDETLALRADIYRTGRFRSTGRYEQGTDGDILFLKNIR